MAENKVKEVPTGFHVSKQFILLIILSVIATLSLHVLDDVLKVILILHNHLASTLAMIFSGGTIGHVLQSIFSMLAIPMASGGVFFLGYYILKKEKFAYTMDIIWGVWLVTLIVLAVKLG